MITEIDEEHEEEEIKNSERKSPARYKTEKVIQKD